MDYILFEYIILKIIPEIVHTPNLYYKKNCFYKNKKNIISIVVKHPCYCLFNEL